MPKSKEIHVYIGSKIREARIMRDLSREELARTVGVTVAQIQKYESGVNRISASTLFALAELFEIEPKFFYDGVESVTKHRTAES